MSKLEAREKRVIMESVFKVVPMNGDTLYPYFNDNKGYLDIGTFEVKVPGCKESVPFDFETTVKALNEDGTCSYGNWDGLGERIFDVDPCFEDDYAKIGLKMDDITAKLLASAEKIEEINLFLCDMKDEPIPCFVEVQKIEFMDEWEKEYHIDADVLKDYNRRRVAEQVVEFIQKHEKLPTDMVVRQAVVEDYIMKFKSMDPAGIFAVIDSIQRGNCYKDARAEADFLIDCMLEVAESKIDIYRVGLVACGNPDFWEDPDKRLPGTYAKYVYKDSIKECQKAVLSYINEHDLGGGQWAGGLVFKGGSYFGGISYNGRFWDKDSEYYNLKALKNTDIPKWDADICGYGKSLFHEDIMAKKEMKKSLKRQIGKNKVRSHKEVER